MTTNQNNKKKNTAARKLIPAIGMLTVSAMMLSSSTYAWFTMNKVVTVNGMEVKTKVGSNLLICDDNVEANYKADNLSQSRKVLLEPVSTINATTGSFFYTVDAAADGSKAHAASGDNVYKAYSEAKTPEGGDATNTAPDAATSYKNYYDSTFNSTYGITTPGTGAFGTAYGYVDYIFYLKGTSDAANQQIVMSECNLIYMGANDATNTELSSSDKAWRIAVFADDITTGRTDGLVAADPAGTGKIAKAILTPSEAALFNSTAVASTTAKSGMAVAYNTWNANNLWKFSAAGETVYEKVTVRVWLEGEDTTCKSSTYAELSNRYKLNLKFEIADSSDVDGKNVDNIGSAITGAPAAHIATDPA